MCVRANQTGGGKAVELVFTFSHSFASFSFTPRSIHAFEVPSRGFEFAMVVENWFVRAANRPRRAFDF